MTRDCEVVDFVERTNNKENLLGDVKLFKRTHDENSLKKKIFKNSSQIHATAAPTFLSENSLESLDSSIVNVDANDGHLPLMLSSHVVDIYQYLRWKEVQITVPYQFLKGKKVPPSNRRKLLDWLASVHLNFKLMPETLYLTKQLLDTYLSSTNISNTVLQLVGVTCLWISAKFEEIYPPTMEDLLYVTDNIFDSHEMSECERSILKTMEFDVNLPTSLSFLKRASKCTFVDETSYFLAKYILEQSFLEYEMAHFLPSHMAAASLYLATILIKSAKDTQYLSKSVWTKQSVYYTAYCELDLKTLATKLSEMLVRCCEKSNKNEVYKKYRHPSCKSVSRLAICTEASTYYSKYLENIKLQKVSDSMLNKLRVKTV